MEALPDHLSQEREEGLLLGLTGSGLKVVGCREITKYPRLQGQRRTGVKERFHVGYCL